MPRSYLTARTHWVSGAQRTYARTMEQPRFGAEPVALRRYQPKGSWYQGAKRRNWIPFSMWTPPGAHRREAKRKAVQSEWKTFKGT